MKTVLITFLAVFATVSTAQAGPMSYRGAKFPSSTSAPQKCANTCTMKNGSCSGTCGAWLSSCVKRGGGCSCSNG